MDEFIPLLLTTDTRKKIAIGGDILQYLSDPGNSIQCDDIGMFIDGILPWMQNSNFKVSTNGLEIMSLVVERIRDDFKPYLSSVLPSTVDRLGDSKDSVRQEARHLISLLMTHVVPPNSLFDRLTPAFSHKNGRVREELMLCLQNTLMSHGATSVTISRLLPHIVKLLSDPGAPVRDMAFNTLVEAYRHYGDRLRTDLCNKYSVPQSKLPALLSRFDEAKNSGLLLPTALTHGDDGRGGDDETDRASIKSGGGSMGGKSRASSAPPVRRTVMGAPLPPKGQGSAGAGCVDENYFFSAFEDVPKISLFNARELDENMNKIKDVIGNASNDWDKRVEMLRKIRSVVIAGGPSYDEFYPHLRQLETAMILSIKDLRSQVVREACVSVAYLSQELHHRVDHLCEMVLPPLIVLIPNGAKVMATSGMVCIRFIIQNTHHHKIIPIIVRELTTSKSKEIRKALCEFLDQLVHTWPPHAMDKHAVLLAEGIKKGICDADSEARAFARKAYWGYAQHFREEADKLLNSLESSYRKMLQGEAAGSMSNSNSSHSMQHHSTLPTVSHSKPALAPRSSYTRPSALMTSSTSSLKLGSSSSSSNSSNTGSLRRVPGGGGGGSMFGNAGMTSSYTRPSPPPMSPNDGPSSLRGHMTTSSMSRRRDVPDAMETRASPSPVGFRSNSAIDVNAARRAQARSQYASANRMRAGSGVSLPRPRKTPLHSSSSSSYQSPGVGPPVTSPPPLSDSSRHTTRPRTRTAMSQPGSRSGSPSSRLSYATYTSPGHSHTPSSASSTLGRTRRRSGIPRSTGTSREPSPSRYGGAYGGSILSPPSGSATPKNRSRSISGMDNSNIPPLVPSKPRTVMAEKILQQSREAESALADALVSYPPSMRSPHRRQSSSRGGAFDDHSENESETSSVCSDRSYDSYRRNELHWYNGPQQTTLKEDWDEAPEQLMDVPDIINNCASTHWGDRKDGLIALHTFLKGSSVLSGSELKRITEIFTKMFMDAHTKVFTLFLDALMQLIYVHKEDLHDWLYVLITRLLHKLGSDLLGSVQSKIHETLDIVRSSFPTDAQFKVIMRFLVDPTQTPNSKVKLSTLTYLKCLVDVMERKDMSASHDTPVALAKILTWTADQKSVEIRRASSACFVAMFNCNMTEFTSLLQQLPSPCQNTASQIIQNHLKRAASLDSKSPSSLPPRTPPTSGGTPVLQSPNTSLPRTTLRPSTRHNTLDLDDTENLNPDDVYKSLKRTTDEIRNYSFELELNNQHSRAARDNLEKHRDSTSQDSGISQLSAGGGELRSLEVMEGSLGLGGLSGIGGLGASHSEELSAVLSGRSSSVSSPISSAHRPPTLDLGRNGITLTEDEVDHLTIGEGESDSASMAAVLEVLQMSGGQRRPEDRRAALTTLVRLARTGSTIVWNDNFRAVLRLLVENLESSAGCERALVLTVLTEMMRRCPLVSLFLNYSELIILRVLKAHGDREKEVVRAAQVCAGTVAEILPPEVVIRVLKPLIQMGEYPVNQSAIKMLNKLVEAHPPAIVAQALPDIMPGLVKAYDNKDSSVRKASVFCMVSLHNCVGEDTLRPHLESLTGSKLKLLNLYIKRADTHSSGASSPKSESPF